MKYFNVYVSNGDDDRVYSCSSESEEMLIQQMEVYPEEFNLDVPGWFLVSISPKRGGYRPGSGRKPEGKIPPTMARRVPTEWADKIRDVDALLAKISDWRDREKEASQTSPRWERMREFLKEVEELGL